MIPKVIHYCWFGNNPMSELGLKCIESWKKYCPDYEIRLWNESNINLSSVAYMREAYEAKVWGFVPDVARLQIIYENGGIYLDTDVELLKPLDDLLENKAFAGLEGNEYVALGLGFGGEKGNATIKKLLDDYLQRHFRLADGTYDKTAAPRIQTNALVALGFKPGTHIQEIDELTIYPSEFFCPMDWRTGELNVTENTYSIHHYEATWFSERRRRDIQLLREVFQKYGKDSTALLFLMMFKDRCRELGLIPAAKWGIEKMIKHLFIFLRRPRKR